MVRWEIIISKGQKEWLAWTNYKDKCLYNVVNRKFCAISGASAWRLIYEVCKRQQDGQEILWSLIICKGQHGGQKGRRLLYVKLQLSIVHQQQSVLIHLKIGSKHFGILLQFETLRKWSVSIINANSQNWLTENIKKKT